MSTQILNKFITNIERHADRVLGIIFRQSTAMHPITIEKKMCKAIDEGARVFMRKVYAPNRITISIHPDDMKEYRKYYAIFIKELQKTAEEHIRNNVSMAENVNGPILIEISEDVSMQNGEVSCCAELVSKNDDEDNGR